MAIEDRWMLPDGVQELLPEQASVVEAMRRGLLDLFHAWGYDLVVPPLVEFTESLLLDQSHDLDIQSFKVTDQISGRTMAVRADITAQVSRIDAHSLARQGISRLCYVGSVLHTKPSAPLASRAPIQAGAELFGEPSIAADIEVVELMLDSLALLEVKDITLDLGHVGLYRRLITMADISDEQADQIFSALQRKSATALERAMSNIDNQNVVQGLTALRGLHGGVAVLEQAKSLFESLDVDVSAELGELKQVIDRISARFTDINLYIDLGELRGYQYHTGLVFSAYVPGVGVSVANGGRYDSLAQHYGRARAATGFNLDLKALTTVAQQPRKAKAICADYDPSVEFADHVKQLRQRGERVVVVYDGNYDPSLDCNRRLILKDEGFELEPMEEF